MKDQFIGFLMGVLSALSTLFRSRKFLLALFAVVQTVLFTLRPDINQDIWKAIDALVAILIASIAHEDAAAKRVTGGGTAPVAIEQAPDVLSGTLRAIGASYQVNASAQYQLTGVSVRRGVSAFCRVTVIGADNRPVVGAYVCNLFPDGNGEFVQSDGSGQVQFNFAASSAFSNPGAGPFTVEIADGATKTDDPPKRLNVGQVLSEVVRSLGDFQGEHTEIYLQFAATPAPVIIPPSAIPVLTAPLDVALRKLSWNRRGIDFNPDAALFKVAQHDALGYPLSGEFNFKDSTGRLFVAQQYANGIAWCEVGHYALTDVVVTTWL